MQRLTRLLRTWEVNKMVEWKKLGEICTNLDFKRKPITSAKRVAGIYPYYGASGIVDYVENYIFDGDYLLVSEDGANLLARTSPIAFSIKGKNWVNNHAHVLEFKNLTTQKFVEVYLNMIDLSPWINGAAQPKLNQANLSIIDIPFPPLSEQNRIVGILDTFTASIENLKEQITQRRKQFEFYRDHLLDLEGKEGVEMKTLGEICNIKGRIGFRGYTRDDQVEEGMGALSLSPGNIINGKMDYSNSTFITWDKYEESPEIKIYNNDVVFCKTGSTVGKVAIVKNLPCKATINPQLVVLKDITINFKYLAYSLAIYPLQYKVKVLAGVGSVPNISQSKLGSLEIPIP